MLERFRRRESVMFPLPAQMVGLALMEMREVAKQTGVFKTEDYNMHMELNNPDLYEFIQGRKQGYRDNKKIEDYEHEAYITGVAIALKAIEDSVSTIGVAMPKVTWRQIRKYEKGRIKAWNKLFKESTKRTNSRTERRADFVESVFKSILEEDPSFEALRSIFPVPPPEDTSHLGKVLVRFPEPTIDEITPPNYTLMFSDPRVDKATLELNQRKYYFCLGISDIYFPLRMADARANRRK